MLDYFRCSGPFWMQSSLDIYYVFQIHFWHVLLCRSIKMTPKTVTKAKSEFLFQTLLPFPSFSHFSRCDPFFSSLAFLSFSLYFYISVQATSEFQFKIWWERLRMKMMAYFRLRSFLYIFLEGTSLWSQFPIKAWFCYAAWLVNIFKKCSPQNPIYIFFSSGFLSLSFFYLPLLIFWKNEIWSIWPD